MRTPARQTGRGPSRPVAVELPVVLRGDRNDGLAAAGALQNEPQRGPRLQNKGRLVIAAAGSQRGAEDRVDRVEQADDLPVKTRVQHQAAVAAIDNRIRCHRAAGRGGCHGDGPVTDLNGDKIGVVITRLYHRDRSERAGIKICTVRPAANHENTGIQQIGSRPVGGFAHYRTLDREGEFVGRQTRRDDLIEIGIEVGRGLSLRQLVRFIAGTPGILRHQVRFIKRRVRQAQDTIGPAEQIRGNIVNHRQIGFRHGDRGGVAIRQQPDRRPHDSGHQRSRAELRRLQKLCGRRGPVRAGVVKRPIHRQHAAASIQQHIDLRRARTDGKRHGEIVAGNPIGYGKPDWNCHRFSYSCRNNCLPPCSRVSRSKATSNKRTNRLCQRLAAVKPLADRIESRIGRTIRHHSPPRMSDGKTRNTASLAAGQICRTSLRANSHPGSAETGAPGSKSSQPQGCWLTIRSMPMPSIMPPTRLPVTPAETPSQIISPRVIMVGVLTGGGMFDKPPADSL